MSKRKNTTSRRGQLQSEMETLAEPYRIKMVERIRLLDRAEREKVLKEAFYSMAYINAEDVFIDLATDSGTGAMSDEQWAGMMRGDEAYIRSRSFFEFEKTIQEVFGYKHVIPTHQGRAAENIIMELLVSPEQIILSNTHFDTTRAHVQNQRAVPVDLIKDVLWKFDEEDPFKGNFDVPRLKAALEKHHERVPFILITVLNNLACSSPVSMKNIREVSALARKYRIPVYFDACRFAENAYFIKTREKGFKDWSIQEIVREMFKYGDGCWMSAKKDAIVNIGGFIALSEKHEELARRCQERLVLYEGFMTYGGLAGRDLEALAVGLREGIDEDYLAHRTQQVAYLARLFEDVGVQVSKPAGGSGVFINVDSLYGHLPPEKLPGVALVCDLYLEGGVRASAIPFHLNTVDPKTGELCNIDFLLARFALPRRVYTKGHLDYVGKVMAEVKKKARKSKGYRLVSAPKVLGHFFVKFEPLK
ncbi:MAG: tryptophanase [Myxococcaceae bacterium]|nr:tryptophanase [Myxococcaceae bacterium]